MRVRRLRFSAPSRAMRGAPVQFLYRLPMDRRVIAPTALGGTHDLQYTTTDALDRWSDRADREIDDLRRAPDRVMAAA